MNKSIKNWISALWEAVLILLILYFVCFPARVEGSSMEQTLHHGDTLLICRVAAWMGWYDQGDVVTFSQQINGEKIVMVKRVIALEGDQVATITTNYGDIQIKLCPDQAPKAVENFVTLAEEGYYDGLTFHRVINNFMIQGGDPNGDGTGGESCWGGEFEDEFDPELYHFRGALSMANSGADTNGSQFFIVQNPALQEGYFDFVDQVREQYGDDNLLYNNQTGKLLRTNYTEAVREKYEALGGNPDLDYGYTVFGQVYEGMDVVDSIAAVQTDENDKPVEDVIIESITIQTL